MRRLDIGILCYNQPQLIGPAIQSVLNTAKTDFRLFVVDNASTDPKVAEILGGWSKRDERIHVVRLDQNLRYAGGVNKIFELANTEYVAYLDHDVVVHTAGWDETMCRLLDQFHEVGMVFPNGIRPIDRGNYSEVMWGIGCFWVLNKANVLPVVGGFDSNIGHQNEADYCLRVRLKGFRCATLPGISITHKCSQTVDSSAQERINKGVQEFVTKWNNYFNGVRYDYFHPHVTRWDDWPPNALYLEEYYKLKALDLNTNPEVITFEGAQYDLIKVLRLKGFYRGRII